MRISFSPYRHGRVPETLELHVDGDVLTVNGQALDFGPLPEGYALPADATECRWVEGSVVRVGGVVHVRVKLPHGPHAPRSVAHPDTVDVLQGAVAVPGQETE